MRGYDGHLIIKEAYDLRKTDITAIPNSYEKFMTFKIGELKFIDSFQFMSSSIEKLTETLYQSDDKYKYFHSMKKEMPEHMENFVEKDFIRMSGLIIMKNLIMSVYRVRRPFTHHYLKNI